jgi:hypothetical protein
MSTIVDAVHSLLQVCSISGGVLENSIVVVYINESSGPPTIHIQKEKGPVHLVFINVKINSLEMARLRWRLASVLFNNK